MKPQHLKEANQLKTVRAKCLPLFELAKNQPAVVQESIYRTMVLQIAATLDVEVSAHDLEVEPAWTPRITHIGPVVHLDTLDALRFIRGGAAA